MTNPANQIAKQAIRVLALTALIAGANAFGQAPPMPSEQNQAPSPAALPPHMPESVRGSIAKVIVVGGQNVSKRALSGTYDEYAGGFIDGWDEGARKGQVGSDIGGIPVYFPIPGLQLPASIFGGLTGIAKANLQELRDAMTEDLAKAGSKPLGASGLALDVFWGIRDLNNTQSQLFAADTDLPEDADSILYVSFGDVQIDVQGDDAIVTTPAISTLRRISDGFALYQSVIYYQDQDTLKNWTANENELWRDYVNFGRHFMGRAVTEDIFGRIEPTHTLQPRAGGDLEPQRKDAALYRTEAKAPTMAWDLDVTSGDSGGFITGAGSDIAISYDLEIYDAHQPVYEAEGLPADRHTLEIELDCGQYWWTVRPIYAANGQQRHGEWMRLAPEDDPAVSFSKGAFGREASVAPAFLQDFYRLQIDCD